MQLLNEIQLDFSDVLILPQRSVISSRKDVQIERTFTFLHSGVTTDTYPVMAANMQTGSIEMAKKLSKYKMFTALNKYYPVKTLVDFWETPSLTDYTFYTLGLRKEDSDKFDEFKLQHGSAPKFVCIDAPSAYLQKFVDFLKKFREQNPTTTIMAGNVVTGNMTEELILAGADIVKIGIGSGANCLTRKLTSIGRPQVSAILECASAAHGLHGHICSDGGIVDPGDVNIAFCCGSDFCMVGSMFAGTDECEGEIVVHKGKFHKKFFGLSSNSAMEKFGSGKESYKASEGRTTLIPCKGSVEDIVLELQGGTRSMLSYIGAKKLKEASKRATLIRVNRRLNDSLADKTIGN